MAPSEFQSRLGDDDPKSRQGQRSRIADSMAHAETAPSSRRNDESWVEISSQPSSSSLSSIGDEIITTGLRVGNQSYPMRRRRLHQQQAQSPHAYAVRHNAAHAGASSQEEYDETESEEDRVLTSSTENIHPRANPSGSLGLMADSDSDSDDDENATALGRPSNPSPTFRPQPNAFSHPPSHLSHRNSTTAIPTHPSQPRPSMSTRSHTRSHRGPPNFMSPSYQADNDAALRASLTTLLSCAAAARGLPKKDDGITAGPSAGAGVLPSSQPMELRLVPETELMAEKPTVPAPAVGSRLRQGLPDRTASNSSAASAPPSNSSRDNRSQPSPTTTATGEKTKRAATASAGTKTSSRAAKKKRTSSSAGVADEAGAATTTYISPTLLTWVVSAGVVVLVSVVGFGAGYVIGREVGRQEGAALGSSSNLAAAATTNMSSTCGGDLGKSTPGGTLRRFRWGAVRSVVA